MMGIIIPSFIFGFTILSHIFLLIISIIPFIILYLKKGIPKIRKSTNKDIITKKIFFYLIVPILLLISIILTNHILLPTSDGVSTGQSTYGDLNLHLGIITTIKEQEKFPPDYPFLSGEKLNYPFLVDMLSSSIYLFGTSLRLSVLIPSYVICLTLIIGFYYLAHKISNSKRVATVSTLFFFLGGGLGFIYFLNGAKGDISVFTRMFTEFYQTPTNYIDENIRWVNPICDMIVPQRTTMAGWALIFPCLCLLIEGCKTNKRKYFVLLGILASTMPLIHTHSFLALGVISALLFFLYFIPSKEKKKVFINWLIYGLIVLLIAFPQLFYWTFSQTGSFLKFHFNWVNEQDPYIWFYIKNWGIMVFAIIPAFLYANKDNKKLIISSLILMLLAELIQFQPNEYDNNKLLFITYMILLISCCNWYIYLFDKAKNIKGRNIIAVIVVILSTLSGVLSLGREILSGGQYQLFNNDMIKMGNYIANNTEKDMVFLTGITHINPPVVLAGRNVYVGPPGYVLFHGYAEEYDYRSTKTEQAYNYGYNKFIDFCEENNIEYIYLGLYEKENYFINWITFSKLKKVISFGEEELYKIN